MADSFSETDLAQIRQALARAAAETKGRKAPDEKEIDKMLSDIVEAAVAGQKGE